MASQRPTEKTCCVCGGYAGKWYQWFNQDTGYSICASCLQTQHETKPAATSPINDLYGKAGHNRPLLAHEKSGFVQR